MKKKTRVLAVLLAALFAASGCSGPAREASGSVSLEAQGNSGQTEEVQLKDETDQADVAAKEAVKEETVEDAVEAATEDAAENNQWKEAYLQVMEENQRYIRTYENTLDEWAISWKDDESLSKLNPSPSQMCLHDLDRDGVPELIYVANTDNETVEYPEAQHDLYVYTYKDNEARLICQELAALEAGGGWYYYLAIEADRLVLVKTAVDQWFDTEISWFLYDGQTMECVEQRYLYDANEPDISPRYMSGEASDAMQEIDEDEYVRESHMLTQGFEKLLMRNMDLGIPAYDYERNGAISALTYSGIHRYLQGDADSRAEEGNAISPYFTNEQLENIRRALLVPDDLSVEVEVSEAYYWEAGDMELAQIDFYHDGEFVAGAAFRTYSEEMVKEIYIYSE